VAFTDSARAVGDGDFEDRLCEIHGDGSRLQRGLLPFSEFALLTTLAQRCRLSRGRSPFHRIHLSVYPVTALAHHATAAPVCPAGDARRSADER
jgi:hypothetical protein